VSNPRIGVVGIPGKWSTEALADALEERTGFRHIVDMGRVDYDLAAGSVTHDGLDLTTLDGLVVKKISEIYSPHALDRLELLRVAEAKGVKVFSKPESILRLMDRLACTVSLALAGAPMPPTRVTEDLDVAKSIVKEFGGAVLKPLFSTKARGMELVDADDSDLDDALSGFKAANPVMYIQKKLDLSGQDLGMVFLGGEYLCTYARVSSTGAWNTTINSGGKYAEFRPDDDLIALARNAQAPFGLDFTTVDVALTPLGPVVFEVSAFGGFRGVKEGCGLDAAALLADHVLKKVAA